MFQHARELHRERFLDEFHGALQELGQRSPAQRLLAELSHHPLLLQRGPQRLLGARVFARLPPAALLLAWLRHRIHGRSISHRRRT